MGEEDEVLIRENPHCLYQVKLHKSTNRILLREGGNNYQ